MAITNCYMATFVNNDVSPGAVVQASDHNTQGALLAAVINGGIENTNVAANAAIATSKLADDSGVTHAKVAAGFVVQMASTNYSAVATGTTLIPSDDTIPQNTEGDEYMTISITPKSATNILVIEAVAHTSHSVSSTNTIALFQDSTANALAANSLFQGTGTGRTTLVLKHRMVAGTTAATTFKVRIGGSSAGTTTFNGSGGGRIYGGITGSNITVTEFKA